MMITDDKAHDVYKWNIGDNCDEGDHYDNIDDVGNCDTQYVEAMLTIEAREYNCKAAQDEWNIMLRLLAFVHAREAPHSSGFRHTLLALDWWIEIALLAVVVGLVVLGAMRLIIINHNHQS